MKSRCVSVLFICLLMTIICVSVAGAQDWTAGAGLAWVPDYIGSDDYEVAPLPYLTVDFDNHMNARLVGNRIQSNLVPHPIFKAGPVGEYIPERDDVDNDRVDAMDDVDASFMVGAFAGFEYEGFNGRVEFMGDVADGNDGTMAQFALGWGTGFAENMRINFEGFTKWGDDDFMEAYFEVDLEDSIRSGLPLYSADSGFYEVGLNITYSWNFTGPWTLILSLIHI